MFKIRHGVQVLFGRTGVIWLVVVTAVSASHCSRHSGIESSNSKQIRLTTVVLTRKQIQCYPTSSL